jgi:hypothetical protein
MPEALLPFVSPTWFPLVSHKLMRLVCPWALLVLFGASVGLAVDIEATEDVGRAVALPELWLWRTLAAAQILFYALALLGRYAGRIGEIARTFVVLNVAAVVGFWRFTRGTQQVTW